MSIEIEEKNFPILLGLRSMRILSRVSNPFLMKTPSTHKKNITTRHTSKKSWDSLSSSLLLFLSRLLPPYLKNKTEEKKRPGFTLVELMVVMAIISILATAGLSAYTGYLKGARDSKRESIAREMRTIVESLTTITGAPTPEELDAYLVAEGLAWGDVMPEKGWIGLINVSMSSVYDTLNAATDLVGIPSAWAAFEDPTGGKAVCVNDAGDAIIVCQFVYYKFSDGTYAISYGVEQKENLVNPHYSGLVDPRTYGSFVGNSAAITIPHSTTNIESSADALSAVGITTTVEVARISTVPSGGCNGSACNGGCGGLTCSSEETCTEGVCASTVTNIDSSLTASPGTAVSDISTGTYPWYSIDNVKVQDNIPTSAIVSNRGTNQHLKATNFGFAVPNDAVINGVMVEVYEFGEPSYLYYENNVKLIKPDSTLGTQNKARKSTPLSYIGTYTPFGSSTDLWGETWSPADINSPNFGIALQYDLTSGCLTKNADISTPSGYIKMYDLKVGDTIMSFNEVTRKTEEDIVSAINILPRKSRDIYEISVEGAKRIDATFDHKFYTANRGQVQATDLIDTDILIGQDLENKKILKIRKEVRTEEVYDITVKKNHNFFANSILVHNSVTMPQVYIDHIQITVYFSSQ